MCLQSSCTCGISSLSLSPISLVFMNAVNFPGTSRPFSMKEWHHFKEDNEKKIINVTVTVAYGFGLSNKAG